MPHPQNHPHAATDSAQAAEARETAAELAVDLPREWNITDLLEEQHRANPRFIAYARKNPQARGGQPRWVDVSVAEFRDQARTIAKSLMEEGLGAGDRVAIFSPTRYEWTLMDLALWYAGVVSVPIFETSSPAQVRWILEDSGAVAAFTDGAARAKVLADAARELGRELTVWQFQDSGPGLPLRNLLKEADVTDDELETRRSLADTDTLATLVYTSGTTGRAKGCELTHGNFLSMAKNVVERLPELLKREDSRTILFLPLAHALARAVELACLTSATTLAHTPSVPQLAEDMASFKPTFLLCVPRIFEKVHATAQQKAEDAGKGKIFALAERTAVAYAEEKAAGKVGLGTRVRRAAFDRLLYSKIRASLGGDVEWAISGASPLNPRIAKFFEGIGVPVLEGYGLTESTAPAAVNFPGQHRIGTVGRPVPGTGVRIAEDGEVLLRGVGVFRGYWNNPEATAQAFTGDGWFRTGDLGSLDDEGFLTITGRKKDLIVTAGGKNVSPTFLEDQLRLSPLVDQAVVVGDNRPFISALVTVDEEALGAWLGRRSHLMTLEDATRDPDVRQEIQKAVDEANMSVSRAESVRKFTILPATLSVESGHLTPTLKVKRAKVLEDFAQDVEALYR